MKKVLLVIVLSLLCISHVVSQNYFKVDEFKADQALNVNTRVSGIKDVNDNLCVKVVVKVQALIQNGLIDNINDIEIETKSYALCEKRINDELKSQVIVYLSTDCRSIDLTVKGFGSLEYPFGKELKSETSYTLTLGPTEEGLALRKNSTPTTKNYNYLVLTVKPATAKVTIDNKVVTLKNGEFMHKYTAGRHIVKVENKLYHTRIDTIFISAESGKKLVHHIDLKPAYGFISINSNPTGAQVYIGDDPVGETPCISSRKKSGKHTITIQKENYNGEVRDIFVDDGDTTFLFVRLTPVFSYVTIQCDEADEDAVILINDIDTVGKGKWSGIKVKDSYKVSIHRDGFQDKDTTININQDTVVVAFNALTPKKGKIDVNLDNDYVIYFDGVSWGRAPNFFEIPVGKHKLELRKNNACIYRRSLDIRESGEVRIDEDNINTQKEIRLSVEPGLEDFDLYIDDNKLEEKGEVTTHLTVGTHDVVAVKDNYSFEREIEVSEIDNENNFIITMDRLVFKLGNNGPSFAMIRVPGGQFEMGCDRNDVKGCAENELPQHKVELEAYYIGETEVTQELWKYVTGFTVQKQKNMAAFNLSLFGTEKTCPIYYVNQEDILSFIKKLNKLLSPAKFSLPTEAQWEYAARLGLKSKSKTKIENVAWYVGNALDMAQPVKRKLPDALGLYDMYGNVSELCQDYYANYTSEYQFEPSNVKSGGTYVVRRGGWYRSSEQECTPTRRDSVEVTERMRDVGFRLVLKLNELSGNTSDSPSHKKQNKLDTDKRVQVKLDSDEKNEPIEQQDVDSQYITDRHIKETKTPKEKISGTNYRLLCGVNIGGGVYSCQVQKGVGLSLGMDFLFQREKKCSFGIYLTYRNTTDLLAKPIDFSQGHNMSVGLLLTCGSKDKAQFLLGCGPYIRFPQYYSNLQYEGITYNRSIAYGIDGELRLGVRYRAFYVFTNMYVGQSWGTDECSVTQTEQLVDLWQGYNGNTHYHEAAFTQENYQFTWKKFNLGVALHIGIFINNRNKKAVK